MISVKLKLLEEALRILEGNSRGSYTIPAPTTYPNQWSWDSAFIAIGHSNYDQARAMKELLSIFEGQWKNGMLPHIIYRAKGGYFPGPGFWKINGSEYAPDIKTSGITQPPVHAIAALQVYMHSRDRPAAKAFIRKMFPKILDFHRYLMTRRDPEKTGLVTIFHPWESGLDNSIRWDGPMSRLDIKGYRKPRRKDTRKVPAIQRPTNEDYKRFIALVELLKECRYDDEEIYRRSPFLVKEVIFSTILLQANRRLLEMADIAKESDSEIRAWIRRAERNYLKYFCDDVDAKPIVYDYDLVEKAIILKRTSASLISLYSGMLTKEQAGKVLSWMKSGTFYKKSHGPIVSSIPLYEEGFSPVNYWRGPMWININWMIYKGLKHHGFHKDAEDMWSSIINLIRRSGFHEYYNPLNGEGLGARDFSWTASLLLDILFEDRRVRDIVLSNKLNSDNVLSYIREAGANLDIVNKVKAKKETIKSFFF